MSNNRITPSNPYAMFGAGDITHLTSSILTPAPGGSPWHGDPLADEIESGRHRPRPLDHPNNMPLSYAKNVIAELSSHPKKGEDWGDAANRVRDNLKRQISAIAPRLMDGSIHGRRPVAGRLTVVPLKGDADAYGIVFSPLGGDSTLDDDQLLDWALTLANEAPDPLSGVVVSQIPDVRPQYQIKVPGSSDPLDLSDPIDVAAVKALAELKRGPVSGDGLADMVNSAVSGGWSNIKDFWQDLDPSVKNMVKGSAIAAASYPLVKGLFRSVIPVSVMARMNGSSTDNPVNSNGTVSTGNTPMAGINSNGVTSDPAWLDGTVSEGPGAIGSISVPVGFWLTLRKLGDSYNRRALDAPYYASVSAPVGGDPNAMANAVVPRVWVGPDGAVSINPAMYAVGPLAGGLFSKLSPGAKKIMSKVGSGALNLAKKIPGVGTVVGIADDLLGVTKSVEKWGDSAKPATSVQGVTPPTTTSPSSVTSGFTAPSITNQVSPTVAGLVVSQPGASMIEPSADQVSAAIVATKAQEIFDKSSVMKRDSSAPMNMSELITQQGGLSNILKADDADRAKTDSALLNAEVALAGAPFKGVAWVWPAIKFIATYGLPTVAAWLLPKALDKAQAKTQGKTSGAPSTFKPGAGGVGVAVASTSAASQTATKAVSSLTRVGQILGKLPAIIKGSPWIAVAVGAVWFVVAAIGRSKDDREAFEDNVGKALPDDLLNVWNKLKDDIDLDDITGVGTANQEQYMALVQVAVIAATYRVKLKIATAADTELLAFMKDVAAQVNKLDPDTMAHVDSLTSDFINAMPEGTPLHELARGANAPDVASSPGTDSSFGGMGIGSSGDKNGTTDAPRTLDDAPDAATQAVEDLNALAERDENIDAKIFGVLGSSKDEASMRKSLVALGLTAAAIGLIVVAWKKAVATTGSKEAALKSMIASTAGAANTAGVVVGTGISAVGKTAWNFLHGIQSSMSQTLKV